MGFCYQMLKKMVFIKYYYKDPVNSLHDYLITFIKDKLKIRTFTNENNERKH